MTDRKLLLEVKSHYTAWSDDVTQRMTRKYGWNDITDSYYGQLPDDWPFTSRTSDPRIRTSLLEKNARLLNGKLKGRLVPRESGDVISARINNAVLDYQWDKADDGGSMQVKLSICDMDTRLYQSKFGLVKWACDYDENGKIEFEGNEFTPLDIRDCGLDYNASHIKDAKWFQHRSWEYIEDLEEQRGVDGKPLFQNLGAIKTRINEKRTDAGLVSSERKNEYSSRVKEIRGLEDRIGTDMAFPVIEVVTEYRNDQWITFSPEYDEIIRVIDNPYNHKKIPIVQLRYYPLQDDPLGESEVESVIPLWRAIQATLCGYMDEVILKMRPPLKIIEGAVRLETVTYSPEAQWLMSRPDAVTEMQSNGESVRYFESTYGALVSAFNTAMGMLSQGTSNVDPLTNNKTATEIKAVTKQQNVRDEKNQIDLAEFIKDIMMFWLSNNKQFIFADPSKTEYLVRIVGKENFSYFQQAGLDQMQLSPEAAQTIADILQQNPNTSPQELDQMAQAGMMPKYPVVTNPNEKDPAKLKIKPKMKVSDTGDIADIYAVPEDLDGSYDYIADVRSMAVGAEQELMQGRQNAINTLTANPLVLQLLQGEGYKPKIKELLSQSFEDLGLKDSDRFFEKLQPVSPQPMLNGQPQIPGQPVNPAQAGAPQMGGVQPPMPQPGLPPLPQTPPPTGSQQQMAGPQPRGF
jgi:hypothetical protein